MNRDMQQKGTTAGAGIMDGQRQVPAGITIRVSPPTKEEALTILAPFGFPHPKKMLLTNRDLGDYEPQNVSLAIGILSEMGIRDAKGTIDRNAKLLKVTNPETEQVIAMRLSVIKALATERFNTADAYLEMIESYPSMLNHEIAEVRLVFCVLRHYRHGSPEELAKNLAHFLNMDDLDSLMFAFVERRQAEEVAELKKRQNTSRFIRLDRRGKRSHVLAAIPQSEIRELYLQALKGQGVDPDIPKFQRL